jgi:superkiller protein 3
MLTLGVLNWRKGDFEKADEQLQEALRIATKIQNNWFEAECFNALALIKSSTRQIDEAIDAYKQAIQLAPDQMFVWNNLGSLCAKVGRNDEAMIAFRKALQGNSRDPIAWNGIAGLHFHLGYVDDAIAAYRKAIQYSPSFAQPWCGLGDVYASTGRADEALKCYHKAIDLNPRYVAPWLRLGVLFAKQARYRDAVKAYQKAIALDPRNTRTWNELGAIYVKSKSLGEAADAFRKAIELDRRNGWAYSNLASAYMQQGKHKETISLLLRSIDLFENDADRAMSWNQLARAYRLLGDYRNAVAAYQTADKLAPGRPAAKAERPTEGHEPSATQTTGVPMPEWKGEVPTPSPQDAPVEAGAEAVTTACGPLTAGAETLNRGGERLRIPEAPAWIFEAAGEPDEPVANPPTAKKKPSNKERSAAAVTQAPALPAQVPAKPASPNSVEDSQTTERSAPRPEAAEWTEKGNALFHQGAFEEAAAAYNHAIQLDSAYGVPYSNLALTYLTQGKCAEAILLYQKSIDLLESDKDRALACNGLGNAYRCTNDYASAVTAYQRAADLDPETSGIRERADDSQASATPRSAQAWNNLGELLLKTRALDQAADAFSKAIDLEPTNGRAYCNLARTRAAQIRYREAVPLYEKSIGLLENDKDKANAWNGLGNAYRKLNDYDNAIRAYREAVALADEGVDLLTRTRFSLLSNCDVSQ